MSLCHGWGWQPPQTASHMFIRHIESVWAYWYAIHLHTAAALHSFTHSDRLRFWGRCVTCGVKMMSSCHGWGWQLPQTASLIHIRHIESVWTHWFAVHLHTYSSSISCCGLGVILVIVIVAKQGMCFLHIVSRHFFFYSSIHISYLLFLGNCPTYNPP